MNTFDELYSKIMSNYSSDETVSIDDKSLSAYSLEDEEAEEIITDNDVEAIEDEDFELYNTQVTIEDEDEFSSERADSCQKLEDETNELNIDFDGAYVDEDEFCFDDLKNDDMLTEADDDPFATTPAENAEPATDAAPAAAEGESAVESPNDTASEGDAPAAEEDAAKADEPVDGATKDAASYQVKLDLIISNITTALRTTINTAGSELYDKIIIYGFEESMNVFVEDYLKKMMDGDIQINTIEKIDIITFAAPNIAQIVKKLIENLAKK